MYYSTQWTPVAYEAQLQMNWQLQQFQQAIAFEQSLQLMHRQEIAETEMLRTTNPRLYQEMAMLDQQIAAAQAVGVNASMAGMPFGDGFSN